MSHRNRFPAPGKHRIPNELHLYCLRVNVLSTPLCLYHQGRGATCLASLGPCPTPTTTPMTTQSCAATPTAIQTATQRCLAVGADTPTPVTAQSAPPAGARREALRLR